MLILTGMLFLLPTLFSFVILLIHFISTRLKASDEEAYLMGIHGSAYRDYLSRTGRLLPHWLSLRQIFRRN
jgi:protein-S-isoprenylcysteine O-methyltransferase Ste14